MSNILRVDWMIIPQTAPQPILGCSGCNKPQPFKSSSKIRLNANGKALDAWLIYNCVHCDHTWNRTILRRKRVHDIDPVTLMVLQNSDAVFVKSLEFDVIGLHQATDAIKEFIDIGVRKVVRSRENKPWLQVEIIMKVPLTTAVRLDRILAAELGLSRAQIRTLAAPGHLRLSDGNEKMLQRPLRDGTSVLIDVAGFEQADIIVGKTMREFGGME